jgi:hypothetical protein
VGPSRHPLPGAAPSQSRARPGVRAMRACGAGPHAQVACPRAYKGRRHPRSRRLCTYPNRARATRRQTLAPRRRREPPRPLPLRRREGRPGRRYEVRSVFVPLVFVAVLRTAEAKPPCLRRRGRLPSAVLCRRRCPGVHPLCSLRAQLHPEVFLVEI